MLTDPSVSLLPASKMRPREVGHIRSMVGDGQMVHRLAEMGIRLGVRLQIIRHGKTSLIAIEGRKFSLRAVDLEEILVEVSANSNEVLS